MRHAWRHKLQRFRLEWPFCLFLFCGDGETIDQYVTELKRLAKDCAYGELKSEMIRDRIVCGTNNPQVQ